MWVNRKRKAAARAGRGQDRSGAGRRARSAGRLRDRGRIVRAAVAALWLAVPVGFAAQAPLPWGYLCCNLRVVGNWISDINYRSGGELHAAPGRFALEVLDRSDRRIHRRL